jgi:hypothetical protein
MIDNGYDFVVNGTNIKPELDKLFAEEMKKDCAKAIVDQKHIAEFNDKNRPKFVEGFGEIYLSVDQAMYMLCRTLYGEDCWEDVGFQDWVWKNFEEYRVKNESRGLHVPINGLKTNLNVA